MLLATSCFLLPDLSLRISSFAQCLADERLVAAYQKKLVLRFSEESARMTALSML